MAEASGDNKKGEPLLHFRERIRAEVASGIRSFSVGLVINTGLKSQRENCSWEMQSKT